ncbi:hypothetical protein D3C87_1127320 [compost metagenome]
MRRQESQQGFDPAQRLVRPRPRGFDAGKIEVGVGQARAAFDGALRGACRRIIFAQLAQYESEVAVRFSVVVPHGQSPDILVARILQAVHARVRVAKVIARFRAVRMNFHHPLQANDAVGVAPGFLQDDPQVIPRHDQPGITLRGLPRGGLALCQQALLTADLGQIAEIARWRGACPACLTQQIKRERRLAVGVCDQAQEV